MNECVYDWIEELDISEEEKIELYKKAMRCTYGY